MVDDDIDVFDPRMVEWAVNTRVQPNRDVLILPPMYSPTLDPSAPAPRTTVKWGVDATAPLGRKPEFAEVCTPGEDDPAVCEALLTFLHRRGNR